MNTVADKFRTSTPPVEQASSTARVTYRFAVCGQDRTFTVGATVSGSAAEAALKLITAACDDARDWLRTHTVPPATTATATGLLGRWLSPATQIQTVAEPQHGRVTATVEIGEASHEYTGDVSTGGNPYRATHAAVCAARDDLWNWAWGQKSRHH